ncbi:hypothetical protein FJT64_020000 [Amphibalanus amphitrite]|uniref:RNase H type-1 domain-containing protein n=1 Tax=Amphibalanus amphitrite TaxID=1232801 RepID=A0A6A4WU85_AMPAM|nr:hypothetical protein FJT64_020000 [Amphibalanus amphitrite]
MGDDVTPRVTFHCCCCCPRRAAFVSALYSCDPPWLGHRGGITFRVDLPVATRRSDPPAVCREAALQAIAELPHPDVTIWSDGSARGGRNRAAQALIQFHHLNREETVRAPAGAVCSSLRAELTAMREAFAAVAGLEDGELASTNCDSSATLRSTVAPPRVGALASRQRR